MILSYHGVYFINNYYYFCILMVGKEKRGVVNWIGHNLTCFWKWFIDGKTLTQFIKDSDIVIITKRVLLISSQKEKKWQISVRFSKLPWRQPIHWDGNRDWLFLSVGQHISAAKCNRCNSWVKNNICDFLEIINLFGDNFNTQSVCPTTVWNLWTICFAVAHLSCRKPAS